VAAAAPGAAPVPAKFDPKTSATAPDKGTYEDTQEGLMAFIKDNTEWSEAHPEEAQKLRDARLKAEESGRLPSEEPAAPAAEAAAPENAGEPKPGEAPAPGAAATPAAIEKWTTDAPELKAVFEKYPTLQAEIMETARSLEAAQPILSKVGSPEAADFYIDHASRLVGLQTSWMRAGDDPDLVPGAWAQVEDMFKVRDNEGKEVVGADGKPAFAPDYQPFVRHATTMGLNPLVTAADAKIQSLTERLKGVYGTEEAKAADATALEEAKYEKAAITYTLEMLKAGDGTPSALPALPAGATEEQIAFQKKLEEQQKKLEGDGATKTRAERKASMAQADRDVQLAYEANFTQQIDNFLNGMKERGEYLPEFVTSRKWVNPKSGKETKLTDFAVQVYQKVNDMIMSDPYHAAQLASLQLLGPAGKEARIAQVTKLSNLYMMGSNGKPGVLQNLVKAIQDDIRGAAAKQPNAAAGGVARVEPRTGGVVEPPAQSPEDVRKWAEAEAAKTPGWTDTDDATKEAAIMSLYSKKRLGMI
jgi:hypothetical protein